MIHRIPRIQTAAGTLWAVPSVHHRAAFAEEVNFSCDRNPIDAIAVELGPETAAAAAAWLRDLGLGPGKIKNRLPCMLGLAKPNQRIRPSMRAAAEHLQRMSGRELHDLPPELLKTALGFSQFQVLYFSPTDSIIEALRCAIEMDIPLYGVDLEETADRREHHALIADPALATDRLCEYVQENENFAENQRDEEVDSRREIAMTARLKTLLDQHQNVLFVCGLAHWRAISRMLADPAIRPARVHEVRALQPPAHFQRTVIHPLLAVRYLDTCPSFAEEYENARYCARRRSAKKTVPRADNHFRDAVERAYREHFEKDESKTQLDRLTEDWAGREAFEHLVRNLCILRQTRCPDLFTVVSSAESTMTPRFAELLSDILMDYPWIGPSDPAAADLPILAPAPSDAGSPEMFEFIGADGTRSRTFCVESLPDRRGSSIRVKIPWKWRVQEQEQQPRESGPDDHKKKPRKSRSGEKPVPVDQNHSAGDFGTPESWPPTYNLLNTLTARALLLANDIRSDIQIEPFEGSLADGIDIKSTLRAAARGEHTFFIRKLRPRLQKADPESDLFDQFPVVWIFSAANHPPVCSWSYSVDHLDSEFGRHLPDNRRLRQVAATRGEWAVASVAAVTHEEICAELTQPRYQVRVRQLVGELRFNPDFPVSKTAFWLENTRYMRNPILRDDVNETAARRYYASLPVPLYLEGLEWTSQLILMALPFAHRSITVIAPDDYLIPHDVNSEAIKRGVLIRRCPLSCFSREAVKQVSIEYMMPTVHSANGVDLIQEGGLPSFPEHVQRFFGQPVTANYHLMPKRWRDYTLEPR